MSNVRRIRLAVAVGVFITAYGVFNLAAGYTGRMDIAGVVLAVAVTAVLFSDYCRITRHARRNKPANSTNTEED